MSGLGYEHASDADLLARTAEEAEAFGVFYDRFEAEVLGFFYRATRRADVAADLTAEVFAAALSSASSFNPRLGNARGWLFGIARHELAAYGSGDESRTAPADASAWNRWRSPMS
jgi:DNA-directed RNA polymerase specialized sigma24 family protein